MIQDRRFCVRAVAKSSVGIYVSSRYRYDSRDWYRTGGSWLLSNHAQYLYYGGDLSDDRTSRSKPVGTFPTRWTPKRVGSDSYHGSYSFAEIRSRGWFGRYSGDQSFRNTGLNQLFGGFGRNIFLKLKFRRETDFRNVKHVKSLRRFFTLTASRMVKTYHKRSGSIWERKRYYSA